MNKKFLSAILFGSLLVASTSTFVSCKDYDDDITTLQEQIDKNASAASSELAEKVAALTAQIATLDAAKETLTTDLAAAKQAAAEAAAAALKAAQDAQVAADAAAGDGSAAQAAADKAQATADQAVAAAAAQAVADQAVAGNTAASSAAAAAQATADKAVADAAAAKASADQGIAAANAAAAAAQATADQAVRDAATAQAAAVNGTAEAKAAAAAAQTKADQAVLDAAAAKAAADLGIAEAKAAAAAAQTKADQAVADAAAAKAAADQGIAEAKAAAAASQATADQAVRDAATALATAQAGSTEAKALAEKAQETADKAVTDLATATARVAVLESKVASMESAITSLTAADVQFASDLGKLNALIETVKGEAATNLANVRAEMLGEIASTAAALNSAITSLSSDIAAQINAINSELNTLKANYATKDELTAQAQELKDADEAMALQISTNAAYVLTLETTLVQADEELAKKISDNYSELSKAISDAAKAQALINDTQSAINVTVAEFMSAQTALNTAQAELEAAQLLIDGGQDAKIATLEDEVGALKNRVGTLESRLSTLKSDFETYVMDNNQALVDLKAEMEGYADVAAQAAADGAQAALDKLVLDMFGEGNEVIQLTAEFAKVRGEIADAIAPVQNQLNALQSVVDKFIGENTETLKQVVDGIAGNTESIVDHNTRISTNEGAITEITNVIITLATKTELSDAVSTLESELSAAVNTINTKFANYYTKDEVYTKGEADAAISAALSTALLDYYTKDQIDALIDAYSTTVEVKQLIVTATGNLAGKTVKEFVDELEFVLQLQITTNSDNILDLQGRVDVLETEASKYALKDNVLSLTDIVSISAPAAFTAIPLTYGTVWAMPSSTVAEKEAKAIRDQFMGLTNGDATYKFKELEFAFMVNPTTSNPNGYKISIVEPTGEADLFVLNQTIEEFNYTNGFVNTRSGNTTALWAAKMASLPTANWISDFNTKYPYAARFAVKLTDEATGRSLVTPYVYAIYTNTLGNANLTGMVASIDRTLDIGQDINLDAYVNLNLNLGDLYKYTIVYDNSDPAQAAINNAMAPFMTIDTDGVAVVKSAVASPASIAALNGKTARLLVTVVDYNGHYAQTTVNLTYKAVIKAKATTTIDYVITDDHTPNAMTGLAPAQKTVALANLFTDLATYAKVKGDLTTVSATAFAWNSTTNAYDIDLSAAITVTGAMNVTSAGVVSLSTVGASNWTDLMLEFDESVITPSGATPYQVVVTYSDGADIQATQTVLVNVTNPDMSAVWDATFIKTPALWTGNSIKVVGKDQTLTSTTYDLMTAYNVRPDYGTGYAFRAVASAFSGYVADNGTDSYGEYAVDATTLYNEAELEVTYQFFGNPSNVVVVPNKNIFVTAVSDVKEGSVIELLPLQVKYSSTTPLTANMSDHFAVLSFMEQINLNAFDGALSALLTPATDYTGIIDVKAVGDNASIVTVNRIISVR